MLKRIFIIQVLLLLFIIQPACYPQVNIDDIEKTKYGHTFNQESLSERLSRLENDVLGMSQSGDIDTRLSRLSQVIRPEINPNNIIYPQTDYDYNIQPKRNIIQRFLDNVADTFDNTGVITGYTPMMYGAGYGYTPDIYRNEFRNMFYNPPKYCPRHNTFHNRYSYPYSSYFPPINNRIIPGRRFYPYFNNFNRYNNFYYPRYGNYNRIYSPPNIVTKSAVHILND